MSHEHASKPAGRWLDRIEAIAIVIGGILLWVIVALIGMQIGLRELFLIGLPWVDELARYLHIILVCIGLAYVLRVGGNVDIRLLVEILPKSLQRFLAVLTPVVVLGSSVFIAWGSWQLIGRAGASRLPALGLELRYFLLPTAVGFGLLGLEALRQLIAWPRSLRQRPDTSKGEGDTP